MHSRSADVFQMPATKKKVARVDTSGPTLYVGQWIRVLGFTPAEVVRGTGINEGYLSQIISGKKTNPSGTKLAAIAEFLNMPLGDFYKQPPPQALLDQIAGYEPEMIARLAKNRRN